LALVSEVFQKQRADFGNIRIVLYEEDAIDDTARHGQNLHGWRSALGASPRVSPARLGHTPRAGRSVGVGPQPIGVATEEFNLSQASVLAVGSVLQEPNALPHDPRLSARWEPAAPSMGASGEADSLRLFELAEGAEVGGFRATRRRLGRDTRIRKTGASSLRKMRAPRVDCRNPAEAMKSVPQPSFG
jgi:hypothetical protein